MKLKIKDTFTTNLPADVDTSNTRRQVLKACFSYVMPRIPSEPKVLLVSHEMAELLGLDEKEMNSKAFLDMVTGVRPPAGMQPYAMCYGGHQFGNWAGQLGDGRAINLAEVEHKGQGWAIQLKGAGETPYSRSADGLAVLRSSIREHLCSEAMYHLGVPTTRSLSLSLSGDKVLRDVLYNGNEAFEKGAIVCRAAPSFIRFGNFEIFASRQDTDTLKTLVDYTITEFYPEIATGTKEGYIAFFQEVSNRTMDMILHWQRVGFVHGVMNTDNMSILGLTIDYGPYGWLEGYDPNWTPNTTDRQYRRYRFGNQSQIALWNLLQLANALFPLVKEAEPLEAILHAYHDTYEGRYRDMMRQKLGLQEALESDVQLIGSLQANLQLTETDMTIFFRNLSKLRATSKEEVFLELLQEAFYVSESIKDTILTPWKNWFKAYTERLALETTTDEERWAAMNATNPKYVLRNYMAQMAIDAADQGDYEMLEELYQLLKLPYDEQPEQEKWFAKRPEWARHKVGCSMLSCSS
ncbi:protein adenylyltransferase SelO [Spongiimicrobium salis]|uniref:protein adenylyltransferase SelO n=1 Tax=Spongiimicrobium salis TaxID=1667022 RepID=UPI00374DED9B